MTNTTLTQKVAYAILCVKEVFHDQTWNAWADRWLSGEDRSEPSAAIARGTAGSIMWDLDADAEYDKRKEREYDAALAAANVAYAAQHLEASLEEKLRFEWSFECSRWSTYAIDRARFVGADIDKCAQKAMAIK